MAGPTGAGYVHFNKVSGKNGVYTGAAGSEVRIDEKQGLVVFTFGTASAAETQYGVCPISGTVVAGYGTLQVADINCVHTISHGSAGATIGAVTSASPGVAGVGLTVTLVTVATALTVTAGEVLGCVRSTTTSTGASQISIVITKTA
jgi:hypothetical protein